MLPPPAHQIAVMQQRMPPPPQPPLDPLTTPRGAGLSSCQAASLCCRAQHHACMHECTSGKIDQAVKHPLRQLMTINRRASGRADIITR